MNLGDYLRDLRKKKDWSQRDLAYASGISNAEISRIEAGKRKDPSPLVLTKLAKALGVSDTEMLAAAGILSEELLNTPISKLPEPAPETKEKVADIIEKHANDRIDDLEPKFYAAASDKFSLPHDLTDDELKEIMRYVDFVKSQRK